ncbi:MAG: four helix bundle protein [Saprospiraceae bacterium]|nr:four helix bundle protein [Saprospiraceae bacterium]MBK8372214.1 four helix bundle protein [Saprospiraceae bacterium]MBK8853014.1 four helix bundle protein [Saprospiraceae bacterium]
MYTYNFEKLEIWQLSKNLTVMIYNTTKDFPDSEKFGITNQLRRAAVSIPTNIAEGVNKTSEKERSRYLQIAYGSSMEVISLLLISNELNYIYSEDLEKYRIIINEISNKINAYNRKLNTNSKS